MCNALSSLPATDEALAADLRDFQAFLVDQLTKLREVQNLKSTIVLKSVKQTTSLAI